MSLPDFPLDDLTEAAALVHRHMPPTPLHHWPLLSAATGAEVWVKHENHAPTGAFKVRGGITYLDWLQRHDPACPGIITATRGNHGQSQARAATQLGKRAVIYVPQGNSAEKNAAMRAYGAELREFGTDFDTAKDEAIRMAAVEGLHRVPPFHRELVRGVASYGLEMFRARPDLDTVYVPIGCGSGVCGTIAARDALGVAARVVGVVATGAMGAKLSVEAGRPVPTDSARTFADGMAVREPVAEALAIYGPGCDRIVAVSDDRIAEAARLFFTATHNVAEGAGAAALAALMDEAPAMAGKRVGVVLSGGNIDAPAFARLLGGATPAP